MASPGRPRIHELVADSRPFATATRPPQSSYLCSAPPSRSHHSSPAAMAAPSIPLLLCSAVSSHRVTLLAPPATPYRAAAWPMVSPGWSPTRTAPSPRRAGARAAPPPCAAKRGGGGGEASSSDGEGTRVLLQAALWSAEAAYIIWLFLLPYAPVRTEHKFSLFFACR
jgi:hypothetical protein